MPVEQVAAFQQATQRLTAASLKPRVNSTHGRRVLREMLASLDRRCLPVHPDGSCFWHAVAAALAAGLPEYPTPDELRDAGWEVRALVAAAFSAEKARGSQRMQVHGNTLDQFSRSGTPLRGDLRTLDAYEACFHDRGAYVDFDMVDYAADYLNIVITVVHPTVPVTVTHYPLDPTLRQRILTAPGSRRGGGVITVAYHNFNEGGTAHFEAVVPLHGRRGDGSWAGVAAHHPVFDCHRELQAKLHDREAVIPQLVGLRVVHIWTTLLWSHTDVANTSCFVQHYFPLHQPAHVATQLALSCPRETSVLHSPHQQGPHGGAAVAAQQEPAARDGMPQVCSLLAWRNCTRQSSTVTDLSTSGFACADTPQGRLDPRLTLSPQAVARRHSAHGTSPCPAIVVDNLNVFTCMSCAGRPGASAGREASARERQGGESLHSCQSGAIGGSRGSDRSSRGAWWAAQLCRSPAAARAGRLCGSFSCAGDSCGPAGTAGAVHHTHGSGTSCCRCTCRTATVTVAACRPPATARYTRVWFSADLGSRQHDGAH